VAEGVETVEQLHILREIGISEGQGYLFSKAVPFEDFVSLAQQEIIIGSSPTRKQAAGKSVCYTPFVTIF